MNKLEKIFLGSLLSIFFLIAGAQIAFSFTGTWNSISPGYIEQAEINATTYYLDGENYTTVIEGLISGSVVSNATFGEYDYYVRRDGAYYLAYNNIGVLDENNTDFGVVMNNALSTMSNEGIIAIEGGATYIPGTQIWLNGSGSGYEKHLEIVGVGGGVYPIIAPTANGIHGFDMSEGVNAHIHKLHFSMKTSGTSGRALNMVNAGAGGAYTENGAFMSRLGDLKIEGGSAIDYLVLMEDTEWTELYGQIYIDPASGIGCLKIETTSAAQYHYGSNLVSGQIYMSIRGDNTLAMRVEGASDVLAVMNWRTSGRLWFVNDLNHYNTTALSLTYSRGNYWGGLMTERFAVAVEMNYTKNTIFSSDGLTHLPQTDHAIIDDRAFFEINAGCYANTFRDIHVSNSGANRNITVLNDPQNDPNAMNMYDNWILQSTAASTHWTANTQGNTYFVQDFDGGGQWYRHLGTAGTWP